MTPVVFEDRLMAWGFGLAGLVLAATALITPGSRQSLGRGLAAGLGCGLGFAIANSWKLSRALKRRAPPPDGEREPERAVLTRTGAISGLLLLFLVVFSVTLHAGDIASGVSLIGGLISLLTAHLTSQWEKRNGALVLRGAGWRSEHLFVTGGCLSGS